MSDDEYYYGPDYDQTELVTDDEAAADPAYDYYHHYYQTSDEESAASDGEETGSDPQETAWDSDSDRGRRASPKHAEAGTDSDSDRGERARRKQDPYVAEPVEDFGEHSQSWPTGAWTRAELARGFLVAHSEVGPSPSDATSANKGAFSEFAGRHLDWRRYLLSSGTPARSARDFMALLESWAAHYEHVRGKWLVFAPVSVADALWADVAGATARGALGGYAECRPRNRASGTHFIAGYCADFADAADCTRVLHALHAVCARHGARVAGFKPDFLTTLGVYAQRAAPVAARYTYAELGLSGAWAPPALRAAHAALYGRAPAARGERKARPGRRRRRARRGAAAGRGGAGPYGNPYYSDTHDSPSRPNGRWQSHEEAYTWLVHHSGVRGGAGAIADQDGFTATARARLDAYAARAHAARRSEKRALMRGLYELAGAHGFVCGKWKVFVPPGVADALWEAVCAALDDGRLGPSAKISRFNPRSGKFLVCVYCADFRDAADCRRVLLALRDVCAHFGVQVIANFKADFLSHLGVYTVNGNEYNAIGVRYPLNELGLLKYWPNDDLKEVLDQVKAQGR